MAHYDEQREQHDRENQSLSAGSTAEYDFYIASAINSLNKAKSFLAGLALDTKYRVGARELAKVTLAAEILQEKP